MKEKETEQENVKKMSWTREGIINFPDNNFVVLLFIPSSFLIFLLYVPENSALSSPTPLPFFLNTRDISMHTHTFKCKNENGVERQKWWVNRNFKRKMRKEKECLMLHFKSNSSLCLVKAPLYSVGFVTGA